MATIQTGGIRLWSWKEIHWIQLLQLFLCGGPAADFEHTGIQIKNFAERISLREKFFCIWGFNEAM